MIHNRRALQAVILWIAVVLGAFIACRPLSGIPRPSKTAVESLSPAGATTMISPDQPQPQVEKTSAPAPVLPSAAEIPTAAPLQAVRFAVIGDYGEGSQAEQDVSDLVKSWEPDFIITVGDNNYPTGSAETIDAHIGKYYHEFIFPYHGGYGPGAERNRFFPTLGNHDYDSSMAQPYFDYFVLPGNERYYDFTWGPVYLLALNSDSREPDGVSPISAQAQWAEARLKQAASPWKVVYFHHAPYSSGTHGPVEWMRWQFAEWGASAVLSGHDHTYERLLIGGIPYFVNGVGGGPIYAFLGNSEGSQFRYNDDFGAMLVTADTNQILFQFYNRAGELIDNHLLTRNQ